MAKRAALGPSRAGRLHICLLSFSVAAILAVVSAAGELGMRPDSRMAALPFPAQAWADEAVHEGASGAASSDAAPPDSGVTAPDGGTDANAAPDYGQMSLDELKALVDAMSQERDAALARIGDLDRRIGESQAHLDALDRSIPVAREAADESVRQRYKLQRHGAPLIDSLLGVSDLSEFVSGLTYLEAFSEANIGEYVALRDEREKTARMRAQFQSSRDTESSEFDRIVAQLEAASAARDEAQRKADLVANTHLQDDGADWDAGEEEFVAAWAPRLEAYLAGSPLAGQGETFAKAAWDNHIDPRFSAAISNTESGKGRVCIRAHNAWGWGAADSDPYGLASEWATWEDAINAHARGLASGYGYTISPDGAQKYCPLTWEDWYATTVAQMNSI